MKTTVSESTSARFANLSFLAAIAVVFMHSDGGGPVGSASWWFVELTTQGVFRAAVPFFFFASGFFLARHVNEVAWWRRETWKRLRTILIPFWIWNALFFAMSLTKVVLGNVMAGRAAGTEVSGFASSFLILVGLNLSWPSNGPLWFLRSLFVLILISPLLLLLSRRWMGILLLAGLYFAFDWQESWRQPLVKFGGGIFSWEGLFYFSVGMRMRSLRWLEHLADGVLGHLPMLAGFVGVILVMARAISLKSGVGEGIPFKMAAVPLLLLFLFSFLPAKRFPACLLSLTFPLYCLHAFPLFVVRFVGLQLQGIGGHLLLGTLACAVSACIAICLGKLMPRFYRISFGGR